MSSMFTPRFSCEQTEESVKVSIYCPSIRASDVEINVDDTLFTIHVNPYFLRLNFSHSLVEDDESAARYDAASGYLTVVLTKAVKGEHFADLDLLSKLLAPRPSELVSSPPVIEVLGTQENDLSPEDELVAATEQLSLEHQEIFEAAENDWQIKQEVQEDTPQLKTTPEERYGFLNMHTGFFRHVQHVENEVNELGSEAETCSRSTRRQKRLKHEEEKWDEEHYMADYADDDMIKELLRWKHPHTQTPSGDIEFTDKEKLTMLRLPRKEYLSTPAQTKQLYLTLLTILFSYAYESRTTLHDPTPESGWTLCVLTPAFSALDPPPYGPSTTNDPDSFLGLELQETFLASYRRSLSFPLYRSWVLAESCRSDVALLLAKGKRTILRCLLEMKDILDHHDVYYVYSKIWLDDFCVWIQTNAKDETFLDLSQSVTSIEMEKRAVGWNLGELEQLAQQDNDREEDSDDDSEEVEGMLPVDS